MQLPGAVLDPTCVHADFVSFPSGPDTIGGYFARPTTTGPRSAVIVLHDAFGLSEHFRDVARRFANIGYDALAIDTYSRTPIPDNADRNTLFALHFGAPDSQIVQDIAAGVAFLRAQPEATGRVGVIGFCGGGRQAMLAACATRDLAAAVACWPGYIINGSPTEATTPLRPRRVIDMIDDLACPLYLVGGVEDTNPSPQDVADVERRMRALGKPGMAEIFPDAGHAFFADYRPEAFRPAAAAALWPRVVAFFHDHLGAPTADA